MFAEYFFKNVEDFHDEIKKLWLKCFINFFKDFEEGDIFKPYLQLTLTKI